MDSIPRLLSIGQFARLVGLSVSALRFYADTGLLRPAQVDQDSGYRYYTPEQVATGQRIAALRQLELPLDDLAELLGGPPEQGAEILARHEQRLYGRFQAQRALLGQVSALLDGQRTLPDLKVRFETWPAMEVLSLTGSAPAQSFGAFYREALDTLRAQAGSATEAGHFGLYHAGEYLGGPLQVEVCLPVTVSVTPRAPARLVQLPAGRVVSAAHPGNWTTFGLTFAALHAAAAARNLAVGASYTRSRPEGTELGLLLT